MQTKNIRRKWERRTRMLSESRGEGLQKRVSLSHVNGMYKKPVFLLSLTFHRKHRRGCLVWDTLAWTGFTFNWNVLTRDASAMFLMNATIVSDKKMSATHRYTTRYLWFCKLFDQQCVYYLFIWWNFISFLVVFIHYF